METDTRPPLLAEPLSRNMDGFGPAMMQAEAPVSQGQLLVMAQGREITARKVAVPRDVRTILQKIKVGAAAFGDTFYYAWEVNDRANSRKVRVEGGTITLANFLMQIFGNCCVDCDVHETPTHWVLKAWFIDYENGTSLSRLFQQRKNQNTGMKDADRQADIVFQIGQSKAERNVILNALGPFVDFAIEESKRGMVERFKDEENRIKAHAFIDRVMEENKISEIRVTAVVGRRREDWTVPDLARVYAEMRGIKEGFTNAAEVYPDDETAREVQQAKDEKAAGDKEEGRRKRNTSKNKDDKPPPQDGSQQQSTAGQNGPAGTDAEVDPSNVGTNGPAGDGSGSGAGQSANAADDALGDMFGKAEG